jgi:hypothetical protein
VPLLLLAPTAPVAVAAAAAAGRCLFLLALMQRHRLLLLPVRCLLEERPTQQLQGLLVACQ